MAGKPPPNSQTPGGSTGVTGCMPGGKLKAAPAVLLGDEDFPPMEAAPGTYVSRAARSFSRDPIHAQIFVFSLPSNSDGQVLRTVCCGRQGHMPPC